MPASDRDCRRSIHPTDQRKPDRESSIRFQTGSGGHVHGAGTPTVDQFDRSSVLWWRGARSSVALRSDRDFCGERKSYDDERLLAIGLDDQNIPVSDPPVQLAESISAAFNF